MARVCAVCEKGTKKGNKRSFSMQKTKRTFKKNLQKKKIKDADGNTKQIKICTKCYKTYKSKFLPEGLTLGEYVTNK